MKSGFGVSFFASAAVVLAAMVAAIGCGTGSPDAGGEGEFQLLLTDAPGDLFASAEVTISRAYLVPALGGQNSVEVLGVAEARSIDLLTLRDGTELELSQVSIPAGSYSQLRLVVTDARIALAEGYQFTDGSTSRTLRVPSGEESGIKVLLESPIPVAEGGVTTLVVDFDVQRNFQIEGDPDSPSGIKGVLFTPVLNEKRRDAPAIPIPGS
jgi:hypothetical protein